MRFAFIAYDGMTLLDFAGVYDLVTRLKTMGFMGDLEYDVCAPASAVRSCEGLEVRADRLADDLRGYDYVFIPGGNSVQKLIADDQKLIADEAFMQALPELPPETVRSAVCGGTLALGAAGLLRGKKATTHPSLTQRLRRLTVDVSDARVVEDGNVITARGVASAIDPGLYLCGRIAGPVVREKIRIQMDYPENEI